MKVILLVAAVVQVALGGGSQIAVRMPFLNPAGVTYLDGPAPAGLVAGHGLAYAAGAPAIAARYAGSAFAAPAFGGPAFGAPAFAAPAVAAPAHIGYAAAQVPAVAAVPTVHHVPGVADVPYTRIEAQPGVIHKEIDVAKPAVQTRKFEVRRPAIQKEFYDIEERVVVRPAGSALVELDQPVAKLQRGPAVVSPAAPAVAVAHAAPAFAAPAVAARVAAPVGFAAPAYGFAAPAYGIAAASPAPIGIAATPAPVFISSTPAPAIPDFAPEQPSQAGPGGPGGAFQDDDSVVIDADFARRAQQPRPQPSPLPASRASAPAPPSPAPAPRNFPVEARSNGVPYDGLIPAPRYGGEAVPSLRNYPTDPNVDQANQQRLIQLLTARGGIAEVGFGRSGPAEGPVGDAGQVRTRVLSATAAPPQAAPAGERVSTRRVVVSRPIETVQEVDVLEPVTKLERVAVQHPTLFKTVRQDIARVPTSVPVYGKAFAPAVAHAAVPVAAPAYGAYGAYLH